MIGTSVVQGELTVQASGNLRHGARKTKTGRRLFIDSSGKSRKETAKGKSRNTNNHHIMFRCRKATTILELLITDKPLPRIAHVTENFKLDGNVS